MTRQRIALYPYIASTNKLRQFFGRQMLENPVPREVSQVVLRGMNFIVPAEYDQMRSLLRDLDFINSRNIPTGHYRSYHDNNNTRRQVLAVQMNRTYRRLFDIHPQAWANDREAIQQYFVLEHTARRANVDPTTIGHMASTFVALCEFCEFSADANVSNLYRMLADTNSTMSSNDQQLVQGMQASPPNPDALSDTHEQLLRQAVFCFAIDAYRAAIVTAWAAVSHYVREYLSTDNLQQVKSLGTQHKFQGNEVPWGRIIDMQDLIDNWSDALLIEALKHIHKAKFNVDIGQVYADLNTQRGLRNRYTHQTGILTSHPDALSFLNTTMDLLVTLSQKRVKQFV